MEVRIKQDETNLPSGGKSGFSLLNISIAGRSALSASLFLFCIISNMSFPRLFIVLKISNDSYSITNQVKSTNSKNTKIPSTAFQNFKPYKKSNKKCLTQPIFCEKSIYFTKQTIINEITFSLNKTTVNRNTHLNSCKSE